MCDADLFACRVQADAAAPVEPVRAGGEPPGAPGRFVIEFDDRMRGQALMALT